jgi:hypothetical protein
MTIDGKGFRQANIRLKESKRRKAGEKTRMRRGEEETRRNNINSNTFPT